MNDADAAHLVLRPARDGDAVGFIALIGACWAEYPGCVLDVDGEVPELRALATHFARQGGAFWAAERGGRIVGMVGARPLREDDAWEICRMYVAAEERGSGLAHRLLGTAEEHARAAGALRLVLWSDTRFERSHRFYEKRGYVRAGSIRILDDVSHSLEFRYAKPARGLVVEALDAAAAASAERRLADILIGCVEAGAASVAFFPPLAPEKARGVWRKVAAEVAAGSRVLLAAWLDGALVGTVQLDLGTPENQPHRAEVAALLVDPAARRRGVGRALMRRARRRPPPAHARHPRRRCGGGALPRAGVAGGGAHPGPRAGRRPPHAPRHGLPLQGAAMIDAAWCRLMAAYNTEMNRRLYAAAAQVPDAESRADRGAFFGSLHSTLSHLVWADHTWMARFAPDGWERLPGGIKESPHLFADWDALCAARRKADAGIEARAAGVTEAWLTAPLTWFSGATGREMTKPCWVTVVHLFNHQTHHRGQAHCLITQRGVKPQDTDLPWVVDLAALGFA